jgi:hypothetical protein
MMIGWEDGIAPPRDDPLHRESNGVNESLTESRETCPQRYLTCESGTIPSRIVSQRLEWISTVLFYQSRNQYSRSGGRHILQRITRQNHETLFNHDGVLPTTIWA